MSLDEELRVRDEEIRVGIDALIYVLNVSDAAAWPRTTIGAVLDNTTDAQGRTIRNRLDRLAEILS